MSCVLEQQTERDRKVLLAGELLLDWTLGRSTAIWLHIACLTRFCSLCPMAMSSILMHYEIWEYC